MKKSEINKEFREYVRGRPCIVCGGWDSWNMALGKGRNTPSHIIALGAGGQDNGNLLSMCLIHHRKFEDNFTKSERKAWLPIAKKIFEDFKNGH